MKKLWKGAGLAIVAAFAMGNSGNWNTSVAVDDSVYTIGNPETDITLAEFYSYTCPRCAQFAVEGEAPLQLAFIGSGAVKVEMHSVIRNVVDLTATMLVQCGDGSKFLQNHTMFMTKQSEWLQKRIDSTPAQQAVWMGPDKLNGRRSMAQALGFYDMMATRGYERPELDRCLADQDRADRLVMNTQAELGKFAIKGTPSFVLDGALLENVHNWSALEAALNAGMKK